MCCGLSSPVGIELPLRMVNRLAVSFQISKEFLGCCCLNGDRLRNFHSKAVTVFLEAEGFIERMRALTVEIAGQGELVALRILRQLKGMFEHGPADAVSPILLADRNILHNRGFPPAFC